MAKDHIRYDLLVQDAFRDLFRKVLSDAAVNGLPGEHHFYITFKTSAPGVKLSDRLRAQYPDQMTIVLQHEFWELKVDEAGFEVGLSFRQVPEKLHVPFSAVTGFFDPSVNFGAEFTVEADEPIAADDDKASSAAPQSISPQSISPQSIAPQAIAPQAAAPVARAKPRGAGAEPDETPARPERAAPADEAAAEAGPAKTDSPKVVSIDAFRKKT